MQKEKGARSIAWCKVGLCNSDQKSSVVATLSMNVCVKIKVAIFVRKVCELQGCLDRGNTFTNCWRFGERLVKGYLASVVLLQGVRVFASCPRLGGELVRG